MTPEDCLAAIDRALKQARARQLTDVTVRLDWVYYRELVKLKGIEPAESDRDLWEGQTGLTPDCTLPVETVRKVPIHVNKPPEYASVVRGNDRGAITAFVVRA